MKSVCIAGASQVDLQAVADILHRAGMKFPKPAQRDTSVDIAFWHEEVLALAAEESGDLRPIAGPGRLWEQLASDIFVANIRSALWGWADSRSTWLLDFWLHFEPRLHFILVCVSPAQLLAGAIISASGPVSNEEVMQAWLAQHRELLRFHHRHPQRSLLVDAGDCSAHPAALLTHCANLWKLPLSDFREPGAGTTASDPLALYLARQICRDYPDTEGLRHELAATMTCFGQEAPPLSDPAAPELVIEDYRALRRQASALPKLVEEKIELAKECDVRTRLAAERQARIEELGKAKAELEKAQKELEAAFLKLESAGKPLAPLSKENAELAKERDALQAEVAALAQTRDAQSKLAQERQARIEQLAKAGEELEKAQKDLAGKLQESSQENELLLLQLHQVQEELEHYFLQYQEGQKQVREAEARWQRMLQRTPDYCDYEALEVVSAEGEGGVINWRLRALQAAGRSFAELRFKTFMEQALAGFIFSRGEKGDQPLLRWPSVAASQQELVVIPAGTPANKAQRAEILLDLAAGDWTLLATLSRVLEKHLAASPSLPDAPSFLPEPLRAGLEQLRRLIAVFPATLRYDQLTLKRAQVNPDYEHLWLHAENLALGDRRWPEFEFRLSCAHVRPNRFGTHPKLEFPEEGGQAPFVGWFQEATDDFGAKLELRFALPEGMDMEVWQRLPAEDHAFLIALLHRLPAMLATLQTAGVQLARPWEEWIGMAREMQRIMALRTAPAALPPAAPVRGKKALAAAGKQPARAKTRKER